MSKHKNEIKNKTVLILGAGTGVEAQAAAILGASEVIATDINKLTLKLLKYGAEFSGFTDVINCRGTYAFHFPDMAPNFDKRLFLLL